MKRKRRITPRTRQIIHRLGIGYVSTVALMFVAMYPFIGLYGALCEYKLILLLALFTFIGVTIDIYGEIKKW